MSYSAKFEVKEHSSELYAAVEPEKESLKTDRAEVLISFDGKSCDFEVKAKDFTSFRAMTNAVMRLITIFNKMLEV